MIRELKITGDRQHGKSHLALLVAEDELEQKRSVLYLASRGDLASERHFDLEKQLSFPARYVKSWRAVGQWRILHDSGTLIWFRSSLSACRGTTFDTIIADGVEGFPSNWRDEFLPCLAGAQRPRLFVTEVSD